MADKETIMSAAALQKLEEELEYLKTERRKEVAARIKQAIEFGDISENSEYEDAKNEQAFIEGSILSLEQQIRSAVVVEEDSAAGGETVSVGRTVRVLDLDHDRENTYTIVGSVESRPREGKISNESPVGAALLGHSVGDELQVPVQRGVIRLRVVEIVR